MLSLFNLTLLLTMAAFIFGQETVTDSPNLKFTIDTYGDCVTAADCTIDNDDPHLWPRIPYRFSKPVVLCGRLRTLRNGG